MNESTIGANAQEAAEPATTLGEDSATPAEPGATAGFATQPERDLEHDRAAAAARRKAEAEYRQKEAGYKREIETLRREYEQLTSKTKEEAGLGGEDPTGRFWPVETGRPLTAGHTERLKDDTIQVLQQRLSSFQQMEMERIYDRDVERINQAFGDAKLETVDDLGEEFMLLRANGVSPTVAFRVLREEHEQGKKTTPQPIGSVKSSGMAQKELFTMDELGRLSKRDLDDPTVLERAIRSMRKKKG